MIKLIVGTKGSGKTKAMIDMINDSVKTSKGNVVVVEKGMKLTYEVPNAARLIDLDEYKIAGGEMLYGMLWASARPRAFRRRSWPACWQAIMTSLTCTSTAS